MMEQTLYLLALAILAALSLIAVLHNSFNDNLLQRTGLVGVFFGASIAVWHGLHGVERCAPGYLFTYGMAVYGLGTAWKCWLFRNSKGSK